MYKIDYGLQSTVYSKMSFRFERLTIWQDSRVLIKEIYLVTQKFPRTEQFGLIDQIRRAGVSIALNIAEGSDRKSDLEFRRFLRMAISSCEEVVTGLYIAVDLNYLKQEEFDIIYKEANLLVAKINALVKTLNK